MFQVAEPPVALACIVASVKAPAVSDVAASERSQIMIRECYRGEDRPQLWLIPTVRTLQTLHDRTQLPSRWVGAGFGRRAPRSLSGLAPPCRYAR